MSRQINFNIIKNNKISVGLNAVAIRLTHLNEKIPLVWLNNLNQVEAKFVRQISGPLRYL
jgi:hypothetical protein